MAITSILIISQQAAADVVAVLGSGTSPVLDSASDGDPLDIDLGTFAEDVVVRIFDEDTDGSTAPSLSVGQITVSGTPSNGARAYILVANSVVTGWPSLANLAVAPGVVNLGTSSGGLVFGSTALRDASIVAIAATGDLTGAIDCGKVFRIQSGGTIASSITAYGLNDTGSNPALGQFAVNVVTAADGITGDITAAGDGSFDPADASTWASISRIIVGPQAGATGIRGNIKAEKGEIYTIFTTGPIGTETIVPEIWCADRLIEIRAVSELNETAPLALTFNADIRAGRDFEPTGVTNVDGAIHLIQTDGAVTGYIKAANLGYGGSGGIGTAVPSGGLWGIVAKGPITADIDVDYNMEYSNIIGSSITGTVQIGMMAKGTIVATAIDTEDPDAGRIECVRVGYAVDPPEVYAEKFPRGLAGVSCYPVNSTSPDVWYAQQCVEGGTHDSVIRAEDSIGEVTLRSMTQLAGLNPFTQKDEVPRVESPQIQTFIVDDMRAGVVWSGKMEFSPNEPDPENDYASIHNVSIGCVGPSADIWVVNCPGIDIAHDLLGELHLPALEADEVVRIGDRIGDGPDEGETTGGDICQCGVYSPECYYTEGTFEEDSPRDTGYADKGGIYIREVGGLKGQIIINRNNTELAAGTGWKGVVVVGDNGVDTPVVLGPGETDPLHHAPYYELPSSEVGGGAVGLAPFAFYPQDCTPPHGELNEFEGEGVTLDDFDNNAVPVRLRWYGPVTLPTGINSLNAVLELECRDPNNACNWVPLGGLFSFVANAGGQGRAIGLRSAVGAMPKSGVYRVRYDDAGTPLASNDVDGHPPVGPFPEPGCENDEEAYTVLVRPGDEEPNSGELCDCDWDQDGYITIPDLFAYLSAWFADTEATGARCFWVVSPQTCGVTGLFNFLSCWFSTGVNNPCSPP